MLKIQEMTDFRNTVLEKFEEFWEVSKELSVISEQKKKANKLKTIEDAKNLFSKNGFTILENEDFISAEWNDLIISLTAQVDKSSESAYFLLEIQPYKNFNEIYIKPSGEQIKQFYYKNSLQLSKLDDLLYNFITDENYKEFLQKNETVPYLSELLHKVEENIEHYKNTINNIDNIKYVYSFSEESFALEFNTFEDIFEHIESHIIKELLESKKN